jgi:hypothetical protein
MGLLLEELVSNVEGAEFDVLIGLKKTLEKWHPKLIVEVSEVEKVKKLCQLGTLLRIFI